MPARKSKKKRSKASAQNPARSAKTSRSRSKSSRAKRDEEADLLSGAQLTEQDPDVPDDEEIDLLSAQIVEPEDPKNANKATQLEAKEAAAGKVLQREPAVTDSARTHARPSGGRKWKATSSSSAGV